jgi:2-keto-4-pentenoate hydratase
MNEFDPASAAALLAQAWRAGTQMKELPAPIRPTSISQGYDVQDRLIGELAQPVAGWKLGAGSHLQKRQSGIGRSIAGRVLRSRLYGDREIVPLPSAAPVTVEFEIAYVLARDILPDETPFPVLEAVAEVRTSFELVLSRFVDRRAVGWPSFAADNGAFHALVLGERIQPQRMDDLRATLQVTLDGEPAANSAQGDDITDPVAALSDLVAIARERRMTLPKGSVISTGTVSKPFTCSAPSAVIAARYLDTELSLRTHVVAATR